MIFKMNSKKDQISHHQKDLRPSFSAQAPQCFSLGEVGMQTFRPVLASQPLDPEELSSSFCNTSSRLSGGFSLGQRDMSLNTA